MESLIMEGQIQQFYKEYKELMEPNKTTQELLANRGAIYGDVRDNMNCTTELSKVFFKYVMRNPKFQDWDKYDQMGYRGCMDMVFHKLARIATGDPRYQDNYEDVKGYTELARKIVMGEMDK